jgi:hypothetical protein
MKLEKEKEKKETPKLPKTNIQLNPQLNIALELKIQGSHEHTA